MPVEYPTVVRFFIDEDGAPDPDRSWHMVVCDDGSPRSMCGGQCYGCGESDIEIEGVHYEEKISGRVTCKNCRDNIKMFKGVKL